MIQSVWKNVSGYVCDYGFLKGTRHCVGTLGECLQHDHALNHICNQSNGRASRHRRGGVMTRKLKSTCGGAGVSFLE